jgi:hypothetical protein
LPRTLSPFPEGRKLYYYYAFDGLWVIKKPFDKTLGAEGRFRGEGKDASVTPVKSLT